MSRKRVLVLGGNFGGLTAALAVRHELHGDVDVTVVSASDRFLFNPSLIWLPFGKRTPADITFPLAPTFDQHGVEFVHAEATSLDLAGKAVETTAGRHRYDYLVIATGYRNNFDGVPGLGPDGNAYTITTLEDAVHAGEGWRRFLDSPGDIVIGAAPGAGCFGAAYEYLFNVSHQLRKAGLKKQVNLSYISAEPFLGHFGIGGLPHGESLLQHVLEEGAHHGRAQCGDRLRRRGPPGAGRRCQARVRLRHDRAALRWPRRDRPSDGDRRRQGLREGARHLPDRNVRRRLRRGHRCRSRRPLADPVAVGIPKTGFPTERMAHVAARNIAAQIRGEQPAAHEAFGDIPAVCVMDAGNNGVIILADKMLPPRKHGVLIPGPQSHAMKIAFEKYFLWKARHGYVNLP